MTTIPNLNIVVQQSDLVREAQNIRNQTLDASQLSVIERLEEENKKKNSVHETEEPEKAVFNKDSSSENKKKQGRKEFNKRKTKESKEDYVHDTTGRLLNTIV